LLYAPRKNDPQTPHEQDEIYVVMRGSGSFVRDGIKKPFAEGDVLFAPARVEHRFEDFTDDLTVWVMFYGPAGGESGGDPRGEIERANAEFGRAFARGDAKAVSDMYTATAKLLPPNAPTVEGRAAIEVFWKGVIDSGITRVDLETTEVESFGDTALESGAATLYAKGDVLLDHGKYLVAWKRIEGGWKLHRDCWNSNDPAKNR
jgi:ketosteroid isomerase-like protein